MRVIVALTLLALAATACAADDGVAQQPGGEEQPVAATEAFTTWEGSGIAFAHPASWTVRPAEEQLVAERLVEVVGPEQVAGFPPIVGLSAGDAPLALDELEQSLTSARQFTDEGSEVVERTDVELPGVDAARIVEVAYPEVVEGVPGRELLVLATVGADAVVLRTAAPEAAFEAQREVFQRIAESLRVG